MYQNGNLSIKQPPVSQAAKEKAIKNRAARGGSEGENDKTPCTSKFHFSKGKYGNVVLAWHGVLVQKAKATFPDICARACKIFGATDVGIGNQRTQTVDPEIKTRVGLESESESEGEGEDDANDGDDEDHASGNDSGEDPEDDQLGNSYHGNNNDDNVDDGNEEVDHGGPSHHGG